MSTLVQTTVHSHEFSPGEIPRGGNTGLVGMQISRDFFFYTRCQIALCKGHTSLNPRWAVAVAFFNLCLAGRIWFLVAILIFF